MTPRVLFALAFSVLLLSTAAAYGAEPVATDPVDLGGEPVDSSTDPGNPTPVTAGLWADTLAAPADQADTRHWFTYERQIADSTVHIGVMASSRDPENTDYLQVAVTAGGDDCSETYVSNTTTVYQGLIGESLAIGMEDPEDRDSPCLLATTVTIAVDRDTSSSDHELPYVLKIVEEAPITDVADQPPPPTDTPETTPPLDGGGTEQVTGSTSFPDAPSIEAAEPTTFETEIREGQQLLYKVPLGWGDWLSVDLAVDAIDEETRTELQHTPYLSLGYVDPLRTAGYDYDSLGSDPIDERLRLPPVRYLNRFDDVATLPGDYWIVLAAAPAPTDAEPFTIPVKFVVEVTESDEQRPTYSPTVQGPGGVEGPDGYSPDTPYLVGEGTFAAVASGDPVSGLGGSEGWGVRRWTGLGLGVISLGLCAVGALQLVGRRVTRA